MKSIFGYKPKPWFPAHYYNSIASVAGCALLASSIPQFMGMVLIMEAVIVSVERCWPPEERP